MDSPGITLRAANPTVEDGLAFARLANEASEGFLRMMLGPRFDEIVAEAFLQPDHDISHQNVTFAERDGDIVGMVQAYTEAQHRRSSLQPLRDACGRIRLRMRAFELFLAPLMRLNDSIEAGDYYVQFIAVDSAARSGGVGSILMDACETRAREQGAKRLCLDVSKSNAVARRFYEGLGWKPAWEWPNVRFMPTLSIRMIKTL